MHLSGCPCGLGDEMMTPIDYLEKCVLTRFKNSKKAMRFSSIPVRQIMIRENEYSSNLLDDWNEHGLFEELPLRREPLLCPYAYPSGINTSEEFQGQRMRAGFFLLKLKSPYSKYEAESESRHLSRVSNAMDEGIDLKPYLYYAHWHKELLSCPCLDEPNYSSVWEDDDEDWGEKAAFYFRSVDGERILVTGKTLLENRNNPLRSFTESDDLSISNSTPSIWFKTARARMKRVVYEKQYDFSSEIKSRSYAFGREFCLVIPEDLWRDVEPHIQTQRESGELRCWGEDDYIEPEINGTDFIVIYGIYNSTACRIFNDICRFYRKKTSFSVRGSITIDAFSKSGSWLGNSDNSVVEISADISEIDLLITKRRGELLQKLYIFRTRIFSENCVPEVIWEGEHVQESDARIIRGGSEFIINAKDTIAISLNLTNLPKDSFIIDFQELDTTSAIQRELSHSSLEFRRE